MIELSNLKDVLNKLGFVPDASGNIFIKEYKQFHCSIKVDFNDKKIIYPVETGFKIGDGTTSNFSHNENFVVLECINRLLEKGYRPEHLEIEKKWTLGHEPVGGKADICVYDKDGKSVLVLIECKTAGEKYRKELSNTKNDGGQVFSYWQQDRGARWLLIYASDFVDNKVVYSCESVNCSDDANLLVLAKKDNSIKLYKDATNDEELHSVWAETYEKAFHGDVMFNDDTVSYNIGVKPLKKKNLRDFTYEDKIIDRFEEILRHNNVSDKENAFNRLIALFICKLVDEINKTPEDIVEFQYKVGTDTYESLQDRLQRLHMQGMDEFMKEKIFYIADDYAEKLIQQYTGQKREKLISELNKTLRILKFYTNNDFSFKDVHNEELFYQNGKVVMEMVQLFEPFRIIESENLQLLGDLFERLLDKGFKQNEGQFFTPVPVTRFIWNSLPLERLMFNGSDVYCPKVIDYACGAGHFLTECVEAVRSKAAKHSFLLDKDWEQNKVYGIEKDYRLARVSKISLFMHGSGSGNIVFGDGLENYPEKNIIPSSFDILVANPPYSVSAFKPHLKIKNNSFVTLDYISNQGSEIETLFVERIGQLIKSNGYAAVVLPTSLLNKTNNSFISARSTILKNFNIKAIVSLSGGTFGATQVPTVIMFLEKFNEPPKRIDLLHDSIQSIFESRDISDWEDLDIINGYLDRINVSKETYNKFINKAQQLSYWKSDDYFGRYFNEFIKTVEYKTKVKQKTYKSLSEQEQEDVILKMFMDYVLAIEKEKILYYGLTYKQTTVVVHAPTDTTEQKYFLGYEWKTNNGSKEIKTLLEGGKLYNPNNMDDSNNVSGIIRDHFNGLRPDAPLVSEYFFVSGLDKLLDFASPSFTNEIRLSRIREMKKDPKYKLYRLSDKSVFDIFIGDRVVGDELEEGGSVPVYSANVFEEFGRINKENIDDYSSDSIIWGIDGNWMINLIPAGTKFYPTDHCGVLRCKDSNINTKYLMLSLKVLGEFERYSRANRPSIERINKLWVQIPPMTEQIAFVEEVNKLEDKIQKKKNEISKLSVEVGKKFHEIFDAELSKHSTDKVSDYFDLQIGSTPSRDKIEYFINGTYKWVSISDISKYDKYTEDTAERITQKAVDEANVHLISKDTVLMSFKLSIGKTAITSEPVYTNEAIAAFINNGKRKISTHFLQFYLSTIDWLSGSMRAVKGNTLNSTSINNKTIVIPKDELMDEFDAISLKIDAKKKAIYKEIKKLEADLDELVLKHFE